MGIKYECETVGDLRKALATIPDDYPLQFISDDGGDYRAVCVQSMYDRQPEAWVKLTLPEGESR